MVLKTQRLLFSRSDNPKKKLSAHIIYPFIHFENIYHLKEFMQQIKHPLVDKHIFDHSIYKDGCFRMLWNSKMGKQNKLEFDYAINYEYNGDTKEFLL